MRWNYINVIFLTTITIVSLLPVIVHSRKFYSFRQPERPQYHNDNNYNQQQVKQYGLKGPQFSRRNLFSSFNPFTESSASQFSHPPKQQRLEYQNQLLRRSALQNSQSYNDYDYVAGDQYDDALEKDDQYHNFGGFPNGFNNENGWGNSPFFDNNNVVEQNNHEYKNSDKSFVDEPHFPHQPNTVNHFGGQQNNFPQFDAPQSNNLKNLHGIGTKNLPYHKTKKYGDTIGLKKKHKYKSNVIKSNELLFGPGGLTKNKINHAVKQFGDAYIGDENKDEILHHTNQVFGNVANNLGNTRNRIKKPLDSLVLAIGDATIGHKNKQRLRYNANSIMTTAYPYLRGTAHKLQTNSIHSKVRDKAQQTLDEINYQANLEAHEQIGKLKRKVPNLMTRLDAKAREFARSVLGKFTAKDNYDSKQSYGTNNEKQSLVIGGGLSLLGIGASAMITELIQLAISGTPSLYGLSDIG